MKKIYVDFDDVLCETARTLLKIAATEFGKKVDYEALTAFDPAKVLHIDADQVETLLEIAHTPSQLMSNELTHHAPAALSELNRKGYEIHIVTGRPPQTQRASCEWLVRYQIPFHDVHFVNKYARDTKDYDHPQVVSMNQIAQMNFTLAIEDSAEMAVHLADQMGIPVYLMDRPWNRWLTRNGNIFRCKNWMDILAKVNGQAAPTRCSSPPSDLSVSN